MSPCTGVMKQRERSMPKRKLYKKNKTVTGITITTTTTTTTRKTTNKNDNHLERGKSMQKSLDLNGR
ncbi:hypothetical protein M0802_004589 [Mischocyttarus mexicanus]|nr:hypothetical protein M0802_004589 [Mischocyttarus mexicanus]